MSRTHAWTLGPPGVVFLHVHVQPRARKAGVAGLHDMPSGPVLKVSLRSPPLDGRANEELVDLVAGCLETRSSAVTVESGHKSRDKKLRIEGVTLEQVERLATG